MIVGGRLGDIFGRRRIFLIGISGFTLASAACALAPVTGLPRSRTRVLQGGFGALLIPQGLGVIKNVFPPKEMGGAFAAFGPVMGLAAIGGPILAGWLVDADLLGTGWRMIFLINLPLGIIGLLGALRFMPESRSPAKIRLDPLGVLLISAASLCLIYPLVQGRELDWPLWIFGVMAGGFALLGVFAHAERRTDRTPMIEPSLLRNRAYTSGLVVGAGVLRGLRRAADAVLGVHAGRPALLAGARGPHAHPDVAGDRDQGGRLLRADPALRARGPAGRPADRRVSLVGLAVTVSSGGADLSTWDLAPAMFATGLGLGFVFGPLFNVILAGVDEHEVGSASGTLNAVQQLGNSVGVAVLATIFFSLLDHGHTSPTAMARTALIAAGLMALSFGLSFLLPKAGPDGGVLGGAGAGLATSEVGDQPRQALGLVLRDERPGAWYLLHPALGKPVGQPVGVGELERAVGGAPGEQGRAIEARQALAGRHQLGRVDAAQQLDRVATDRALGEERPHPRVGHVVRHGLGGEHAVGDRQAPQGADAHRLHPGVEQRRARAPSTRAA